MTVPPAREAVRQRGLQVRHLFVVVPFFLIAVAATRDIVDNSFMWHIRSGTVQLDLGRVLTADPFSYASGGAAWRTQSWLAELAYGSLERWTGGLSWVGVAVFVAAAATMLLVGWSVYQSARSPFPVALWLVLLAWLAVPYTQPRPVVLSFVFLALVALILRLDDRTIDWALLPAMWLWAGLHGTWIMGIALIALTAIQRRSRRLFVLAAGGAVVATLTAHGIGVWQVLYSFAENSEALELIQEWKPPDFGDPVQGPYALLIAAILLSATKARITPRDLIVVVPFMLFGLTSRRAVYPAAIVLIPYAATMWIPRLRPRPAAGRVVYAVAALVVALVVAPLVLIRPEINHARFPSDEVLAAAGAQPMFHSDVVGGYLIWKRFPGEQMFIDDRAELFGAQFFRDYQEAVQGDYEELFAEYGMTAAIALPDWPLVTVLGRDGWTVAYEDEDWIVLRHPERG